MGRTFLRRAVLVQFSVWYLLVGLGVSLSALSLAEAADSSLVSSENLYSSIGRGSDGPPADSSAGIIRGRIRDQETGDAVAHLPVFAKQTDSFLVRLFEISSGEIRGQAQLKMDNTKTYTTSTAADGSYLLSGLPTGVYTVWAHEKNGPYLKKSYADPQSGTGEGLVSIQRGAAVDAIDFSLEQGKSIQGTITGSFDGNGIGGSRVTVLDSKRKNPVSSAVSEPDGTYVVQGLPNGKYLIKVEKDAFVDSYYGGKRKTSVRQNCYDP